MEMNTLPPIGWDMIPPASSASPPVWLKQQKYGLTEIMMINLPYVNLLIADILCNYFKLYRRRKDRRDRMDFCFRLQGLAYKQFPAVDGKQLTQGMKVLL